MIVLPGLMRFVCIVGANLEAFITFEPIIIPRRVDNSFYFFEAPLVFQGKGIDGMFDTIGQTRHLVKFPLNIKGLRWADLLAGIAFGRAWVVFNDGVAGQFCTRHHRTQSKQGAVLGVVHLTTPAKGAETCTNCGMFKRYHSPWLHVVEHQRGVAGDEDCKVVVPHIADVPDGCNQGCGDMAIPTGSIRLILDLIQERKDS